MHPVESSLYYTCVLVHWCLPQHPVMFLFNKVHCDLSPIPGGRCLWALSGKSTKK